MVTKMKRWLAFALALVLLCGWLPTGSVRAVELDAARELTQADYVGADLVFAQIEEMESAPAKRNATQAEKTQAAMALVQASDSFVEGSLEQNGATFTWETDSGVRCIYSPRMQKIGSELTPENGEDVIVNEPRAVKGGSPSSNQVYLIGPYYGYDEDFTNQYKTEARRVAAAMGDTDGYTLYSGTAATVDKVAEAISNGGVVFFDSHGTTDYTNPNDEWDGITKATQSYLCLTSTTGLTDEDYDDGAVYFGDGIGVNGATIANHMTKNSPSGLLWMAICWGLGTDSISAPLRQMGVEVVYGYSESVTFAGDYLYEETFWGEMITGKTVAESIATMKKTWGNWDWSVQMAEYYGDNDGYDNIADVRADFYAFPVVVSDEDAFPGKRTTTSYGASSLQTVKSTYTLGEVYEVTDPTDPKQILEEAYALGANEELPYTATLTGTITEVYTAYNSQYGNVTVIMTVPGCEDMPIKCYRLSGDGADQIGVGDTITVEGTIVNYQHSSGDCEVEFAQGCTLVSWYEGGTAPSEPSTEPTEPSTEPTEPSQPDTPDAPIAGSATLSFASTDNRESWDGTQQTWSQNGITLVNEKADSTSAVADYCDPARFYASSRITVYAENMVKLVVECSSATYASNLVNSIPATGGVTVSTSGSTVTIELAEAVNSFTIEKLAKQVRVNSLEVFVAAPEALPGDMTGDDLVDNEDVVTLLWHTLFPDTNPLDANADLTGNGITDNEDVVLLLWHILFPEEFPL